MVCKRVNTTTQITPGNTKRRARPRMWVVRAIGPLLALMLAPLSRLIVPHLLAAAISRVSPRAVTAAREERPEKHTDSAPDSQGGWLQAAQEEAERRRVGEAERRGGG